MTKMHRFKRWFYEGLKPSSKPVHQDNWWNVMCLTGLDYFSTIGFQPGLAFLAAGYLSPFATFALVLVTLFGAYPIYSRVAKESPHGQGSFLMLEKLMPGWIGKAAILALLGFAATDFIITITLCAADAARHLIENPYTPIWAHNQLLVTLVLLAILSGVFLLGFKEAIGTAVFMVVLYLAVNVVLVFNCSQELVKQPQLFTIYWNHLCADYPTFGKALIVTATVFPGLALGLSGFETGVAVMPHVRGFPTDSPATPEGRVRNTRFLLLAAALIMSLLLLTSAVVCTVMIPPELFKEGQVANGRAMAYLAHKLLGDGFGTIYDISTILILWFAGASTMSALLNLVPRYLPRFGMAPDWARAMRPLVVTITVINIIITFCFHADVDAQAGAFATGLLVLFSSAALACLLSARKEALHRRIYYSSVLFVFLYTTVMNIRARPEGLHISMIFVAVIMIVSLISRAMRATELRILQVQLDDAAKSFIDKAINSKMSEIRLLAHRPRDTNYAEKEKDARRRHSIQPEEGSFIFLEVDLEDSSEFADEVLNVTGHIHDENEILRCKCPAVPNAIAAILLHVRDETSTIPNVYFGWTEGHPLGYVFKYIFLGEGETAPLTREILRSSEPLEPKRPLVHVG